MQLIVHARSCQTKRSPCDCPKRTFTDASEAIAAHEGDVSRLEVKTVTPPLVAMVPPERSQATRHTRPISY